MVEKKFFDVNSDVEFRVYEDKGIVVCRLLNCATIPLKRIIKYTDYEIDPRYLIDDTFVGIARCAAEDTFDEEYGKRLALSKAKAKRGRAINKMLNKFYETRLRELDNLVKFGIHEVPKISGEKEG